jgi:ribosomal protein S5
MKVSTEKAFAQAKKGLIKVSFRGNTVPYPVDQKVGSARVLIKPAVKGRGIVAGGAVRAVMSLVGVSDVSAKMLGSKNKLSNARATIKALELFSLKTVGEIKKMEQKREESQNAIKAEKPAEKVEKTQVRPEAKVRKGIEKPKTQPKATEEKAK